jgi:hypothetical protein
MNVFRIMCSNETTDFIESEEYLQKLTGDRIPKKDSIPWSLFYSTSVKSENKARTDALHVKERRLLAILHMKVEVGWNRVEQCISMPT